MKIRQIHPDNQGMFDAGDWVELQMFADGQNAVAGSFIRSYYSDGSLRATFQFPASASVIGQNQRTILVSNTSSVGGTTPDFNAPLSGNGELQLVGQDGAVCFEEKPPGGARLDCVTYGNFFGTGFPAGTPAVATPFGSTLERTITPNCPTFLENADDTNNSATDFALSGRPPRNNATAPTEQPCDGVAPPPGSNIRCRGKRATLIGSSRRDNIKGTNKRDVIVAFGGKDKVNGRRGNDLICGNAGKDVLIGAKGKDVLVGGPGPDRLLGGPGGDTLIGQKGNDACNGGAGTDVTKAC